MKTAIFFLSVLTLTGCKTLVPYDSTFACEGTQDFGRCMDVQTAYADALGNAASVNSNGLRAVPASQNQPTVGDRSASSQTLRPRTSGHKAKATPIIANGEALYRQAKYRELAALIEDPVTPLVQAPRVLRTLVVPYSAGGSLYMPRFVYFLADEAKFVLGDYLQDSQDTKIVYPNASPAERPR